MLMTALRLVAPLLVASGVVASLAGCVPHTGPSSAAARPACLEAFRVAHDAEAELYATHPFHGAEYEAVYEDGDVTPEEQAWLDVQLADEEAKFSALIDPVYDACTGVEDLYASAYALGPDSYWGLVGGDEASFKETFIVSFCFEKESRPACSDYRPDDWR
jgi:hypothetical protein